MHCSHCGAPIAADAQSCSVCGTQAGPEAHATTTPDTAGFDAADLGTPSPSGSHNSSGFDGLLPPHAVAPDLYAGFWRRVAAYVIDFLIIMVIAFVGGFMLGAIEGATLGHYQRGTGYLLGFIISWLYYALQESSRAQATFGKRALDLCVTDLAGERIGFWRASARWFLKILSGLILYIGFMMAGWTEHKQCLHDLITNTLVVRQQGLLRVRQDTPSHTAASSARRGMPGWGIALVATAGCVVVVAIVAASGIAGYRNYLARTQVLTALRMMHGAQVAELEFQRSHGHWPTSNAAAGLAAPRSIANRYVESIGIDPAGNGAIAATFRQTGTAAAIRGRHLVISPNTNGGPLTWECVGMLPDKYLPAACRTGSGWAHDTTMLAAGATVRRVAEAIAHPAPIPRIAPTPPWLAYRDADSPSYPFGSRVPQPPPPPSDFTPSVNISYKNDNPPHYPQTAVQAGHQGKVILDVFINNHGNVVDVVIEHSSGYIELDQAAVVAARNWRFNPGMRNGRRVGGVVRIPVNFSLRRSP